METLLTVVHYFICIFLIVTILLQAGKGADVGAAFGAGTSQAIFGPRGAATFLSKLTSIIAVAFLCTSLGLVAIAKKGEGRSVLDKVPAAPVETPKEIQK